MIKLLYGDCLELMKDIPEHSIDMVLADLPYGTTQNKWDSIIPFTPLWAQYDRVCKENAAIVLFSQMPFTANLYMSKPEYFRYELIWNKKLSTGFLNANKMPLKQHENILVFYKKLPVYNPEMETRGNVRAKGTGGKDSTNYRTGIGRVEHKNNIYFPTSIITFSNANNTSKVHPTQKPVALLEYLIKTYTNENETVLDNCMGSGSTGVACIRCNRSFIGIEKDAKYFDIARERIQKQLDDFNGIGTLFEREDKAVLNFA